MTKPVKIICSILIVAFSFHLLSGAANDKRIAIFSSAANYSLPIVDVGGQEYAGVLEVLEPLGTVSARGDKKHWKLRFNNKEVEFNPDKSKVHIKSGDLELVAPFVLQNGRGLVPISSLGQLLSSILGGPVNFDASSRRIFIGDVAIHFTAQVKGDTSPSLVMQFSGAVNPTIATESGKLQMTFTRDPVVGSGTSNLTFNNKVIPSASYQEGNGTSAITIIGTVPLFASFSSDRKTITIAGAPASVPPPNASPQPAAAQPQTVAAAPIPPQYFAVIDASHGGADRGATLSAQLVEKDLVIGFARRIQQELEAKGLPALLIRSGDDDINFDQRANTANTNHPNIYLAIHVTSQGSGVNLYTSLLPVANPPRGTLVNWETAQASFLGRSQQAMDILAASLEDSRIPTRKLSAPLRPLNNITNPAVAIEIAPPAGGSLRLESSQYQQIVASAVATGMASMRDKLGSGR
jgi:N-acetylmuramoyl-L-alanine amidase